MRFQRCQRRRLCHAANGSSQKAIEAAMPIGIGE
jgi:hypothetical protein